VNEVTLRQHGPLKHWYPTTALHSITTQKTSTWTLRMIIITSTKILNCLSEAW